MTSSKKLPPDDVIEPDSSSGTLPQIRRGLLTIPRLQCMVEREAGRSSTRSIVLDGDFLRVGSHKSNDVVLRDRLVSRFHCTIHRERNGWRLEDTGSLNGTFIGDVRVRDADLSLPDCRISLGESKLHLRDLESVSQSHPTVTYNFGALYGSAPPMQRLFDLIRRVAATDTNVLIEGESGTGKELIAAEIVQRSSRATQPLVVVDCGAVSPTLIESELFGHVRGAFTGALRDKPGAFEEAEGGTVFLDEIGELPLEMQPKLLRVLSARQIRRVGENKTRKVNVRVIAATNRNLGRDVNSGRFREDLYYRLSVVILRVPPLRERLEDIPILVSSFLNDFGAAAQDNIFSPKVVRNMMRYDWPGNVRELKNYVERQLVLGHATPPELEASEATSRSVPEPAGSDIDVPFKLAKDAVIDAFEREYLAKLLTWAEGNISRAARKAGLDRMYLHRLLQRHGLRYGAALD